MAEPQNVLLPHDADGIREYDNPMPAWWLGIFYVTIGFSVVFVPALWVMNWSQEGQYDEEKTQHDREYASVRAAKEEAAAKAAAAAAGGGPASVEVGKAVFQQNCVACHGAAGEGGIGPNLLDSTWIHGGTLTQIQQTVSNGVPEKGMLSWAPILGPEKVGQVAAYVHSLGGGQ